MQDMTSGFSNTSQSVLLRSVAEQLKTPLMVIARQAELQQYTQRQSTEAQIADIGAQARTALRLVDSYLLGLDMITQEMEVQLEPVSLSALAYDVAHELSPIARQYNADIALDVAGKYGQAMGHMAGLKAALHGIGAVMTEMASMEYKRHTVKLAVHKRNSGLVVGVYSDSVENMQEALLVARRARTHHMQQSVAQLTANSGAGILVADMLFTAMRASLRSGRYKKQQGLAATLLPSQQLQFV